MKRKIISLMLAAALAASAAVPAFAEDAAPEGVQIADAAAIEFDEAPEAPQLPELTPTQEQAAEPQATEIAEIAENTADADYGTGVDGFVTRLYDICLGRLPDDAGKADWVGKLTRQEISGAECAAGFIFSAEFKNNSPCNDCYVTRLYRAFMGREPDEGGKAYWLGRLANGETRGAIFNGFAMSDEFSAICQSYGITRGAGDWTNSMFALTGNCKYCGAVNSTITDFATRLYSVCLGRMPDAAGLDYWVQQLANGAEGGSVASGFVFSDEYKNYHTTNEQFVRMMYNTFMGREPDEAGYADWVNKLDYTTTREAVFNGFLLSEEFKKLCAACGIRVGSAIATVDASLEWQYNIQILEECNRQRAANGVAALKTRQDLWEQVAMVRANELPALFSHTRPNGSSCFTAYDEAGVWGWTAGENIAWASWRMSAAEVVDAWMNSPGHRANILDGGYSYLGTGYCSNNFCQNFLG